MYHVVKVYFVCNFNLSATIVINSELVRFLFPVWVIYPNILLIVSTWHLLHATFIALHITFYIRSIKNIAILY